MTNTNNAPHFLAFTASDIPFMLRAVSPVPPPESGLWDFSSSRQEFYPTDSSASKVAPQPLLSWLAPFTILPLDANAIVFAQKNALPYALPNSLLSAKELQDNWDTAVASVTEWTRRIPLEPLGLTDNWAHYGISGFFHYCGYPLHVAAKLAEYFRQSGARLTVFLRRQPLFYDPGRSSDVAAYLWTQVLGDRVRTIRYPASRHQPVVPRTVQQDWSCLQDAVVFSFNEGCLSRQGPLMGPTARECGYPVVWMPYYMSLIPKAIALQALREGGVAIESIPVRALPLPGEEIARMPADAGKLLQDAAEGLIPHAAKLDAIFEEHARLYARFEKQLRMLCAIWSKFRPRLLVAESLALPEYAVPLLAARRLGIPSIGVPHAAVFLLDPYRSKAPATRHAFASAFTEDVFVEEDPDIRGRTGSFTAIAMKNEFPVRRYAGSLLPRDGKVNILVVTAGPITPTPLHIFESEQDYSEALRALRDAPVDLCEQVRVVFKAHPGIPEFWDYRHAGIGQEQLLPGDSIFEDALSATDILVVLNYVGSPSCQAIAAGVPLITFFTEHCFAERNKYRVRLAETGLVAESADAVWEYVRRLIADQSFRNDCFARQKAFYKVRLRPRRDDWISWLKETMDAGDSKRVSEALGGDTGRPVRTGEKAWTVF